MSHVTHHCRKKVSSSADGGWSFVVRMGCHCYRAFGKHIVFQTHAGGFQTTVSLASICKPSHCFSKHCLVLQNNLTFLLPFIWKLRGYANASISSHECLRVFANHGNSLQTLSSGLQTLASGLQTLASGLQTLESDLQTTTHNTHPP